MQNNGVNGAAAGGSRVGAEDVISKIKDDGDFDRLRLKIIRKLKENVSLCSFSTRSCGSRLMWPERNLHCRRGSGNLGSICAWFEELRSTIVSLVKQSTALNSPGAENMKPRQLSDAIHQEIGDKLMSQVSVGLWNVIRSADGMKTEITETVQSVYDKLANPRGKDNGESSSHMDSPSIRNGFQNNKNATEIDGTQSDKDPNEPPGFGSTDLHQRNKNQPKNTRMPTHHNGQVIGKNKGKKSQLEDRPEPDNWDAPPGFSSVLNHKFSGDASDEDPDVPPGFG
ncbi:hypothetical protein BUALT_Bualt05G0065500 [Buddleja alternifolia]|uniref:Uncharacterized protein n=1 Tax=Buddleja alternifolia TaxID=168488 RepID=A0AAV6XIN2_9LAMI|nr:hypothetical protein BUALT_Bualt05G0065500 [Buddleja alternifolia]